MQVSTKSNKEFKDIDFLQTAKDAQTTGKMPQKQNFLHVFKYRRRPRSPMVTQALNM